MVYVKKVIQKKKKNVKNIQIEGIRFIALMFVLVYHYVYRYREIYGGNLIEWIANFGTYGVSMFLVISGYFAFRVDEKYSSHKDIVIRMLSRIVKLWIPYMVSITVIFIITRWIDLPGRTVGVKTYLMNVFFLNGFIGISYVDAAHWYMTQIILFIILISLLQFLGWHNKKATYGIWLIVLTICLIFQNFDFSGIVNQFVSFLQRCLGGKYAGAYIMGILLQFIRKEQSHIQRGYILLMLISANIVFSYEHGGDAGVILFISAIFILLASYEKVSFLEWKPFVYLGTISYGVYLIHQNIGYIILYYCSGSKKYYLAFFSAIVLGRWLTKLKQKSDEYVTKIIKHIGHLFGG